MDTHMYNYAAALNTPTPPPKKKNNSKLHVWYSDTPHPKNVPHHSVQQHSTFNQLDLSELMGYMLG